MTKDEFVDRWKDVWFVHRTVMSNRAGLGHYEATLDDKRLIRVKCRMDVAGLSAYPEKSEERIWFRSELVINDVMDFSWSSYHAEEGANPKIQYASNGVEMSYDGDALFVPNGDQALTWREKGKPPVTIEARGEGPIVPDFLFALYASTRSFDKAKLWPVQFLGFNRDRNGRDYKIYPSSVRYAGRKGPQTGLSHTFESAPLGDGRVFSVWIDNDSRYIGGGDEREVGLAAPDEETARAFLVAGDGKV